MKQTAQTMDHLTKTLSFLIFKMQDGLFALNVSSVLEVLEDQHVAKVPNTPEHIRGVINFRGDILPIIDLREILHLSASESSEVVIVLEIETGHHGLRIGAVADGVIGVVLIPELSIESAIDLNFDFSKEYVDGIFKHESSFVTILDVNKVFALENIVI